MSKFFFSIANNLGHLNHFNILPFQEFKKLQNVQGVAVVIKKDSNGEHKLFKIQSHSLGHALRFEKVQCAIDPHNLDHSLFIAYLVCETPLERSMLYEELDVKEL